MDAVRRRSGEDLISGLPDEVLHGILVRLRCARAAARTSVLSRRWRHVWAHLPEIHLDEPSSSPDTVDGALAGHLAPALERLAISLPADLDRRGLAGRAAPWLRFAAGRVTDELRLHVRGPPFRLMQDVPLEDAELELPACARAQRITLNLVVEWRLRLRPGGLFSSLTALRIRGARMEGGELSNLVCTQCPLLRNLDLFVTLVAASNVTFRSGSLRSLHFKVLSTQRLELVAPRLEKLDLDASYTNQAYISAPKLAQLFWYGTVYDPRKHQFPDVGRRLSLLKVGVCLLLAPLMQRFDEVGVLKLAFGIPQGIAGYQRFLDETKRLTKCKTLSILLYRNHHRLAPAVLHLLRSCNSTRKLRLTYFRDSLRNCPSSCPCCLEESSKIDGIDLGSLNKIEINSCKDFREGLEFVDLLFRCNAKIQKLVIYNSSSTPQSELCEKVHSMCPPNVKVKFSVFPVGPQGRRVRFDFT